MIKFRQGTTSRGWNVTLILIRECFFIRTGMMVMMHNMCEDGNNIDSVELCSRMTFVWQRCCRVFPASIAQMRSYSVGKIRLEVGD